MTATAWKCACGCGRTAPTPSRPARYPDGVVYLPGHWNATIDPKRQVKLCSVCKEERPRSQMIKNRATKDGLGNHCLPCSRIRARADWANGGRLRRYGITPEDYRRMYEAQEGLCALCQHRPVAHIDHDHDTGRVRGLLCQSCNTALGKFADDPQRLRRAAAYLEGDA